MWYKVKRIRVGTKIVRPIPQREVLSSTQCYYPFQENNIDKTGKTSLSSWWTKETWWYRFQNTSLTFSWDDSVSTFCSFWIKVNSNIEQVSSDSWINGIWVTRKWAMCLNLNHKNSWFVNTIQFWDWSTWYKSGAWLTKWQWYHVAFWFNWSQAYMYINWIKTIIKTGSSYRNTSGDYKYIINYQWWHAIDVVIADFIKDTVDRESDIIPFYNDSKSRYWL